MNFQKHWTQVFWNMSKGDKSQYDSLRRSNYIEFWYLLDEFEAEIERKNLQNQKNK